MTEREPIDKAPYRRTSRRPPDDHRCDTAMPSTIGDRPTVSRCEQVATVELLGGPFPWETWVCETCAKWLLREES